MNKKFQWLKKLFTKKVSPRDTKSNLECTDDEVLLDHAAMATYSYVYNTTQLQWINSSDSSLAIVNDPEVQLGILYSYIH